MAPRVARRHRSGAITLPLYELEAWFRPEKPASQSPLWAVRTTAGVFASRQGEVVADLLTQRITGQSGKTPGCNRNRACFLEMGRGVADLVRGNFYNEPAPAIRVYHPGHLGTLPRWPSKGTGGGNDGNRPAKENGARAETSRFHGLSGGSR